MTAPRVSCVVPVFNGERYLGEALRSILAQSHPVHEIVIVDDGSTDATAAVAASFGDRTRYFRQANAGPAVARNAGLAVVEGDFVAFLDADDLWHEEKLARQLACFGGRAELDYCVTFVQNFWVAELQEEADRFRDHPRGRPMPGYVTSTLLARRALFERVGRFNGDLPHADDTDWFLRADAAGAVKELLADVLLFRRMHPANLSRTLALESRAEYLRLIKASLDRRRGAGA